MKPVDWARLVDLAQIATGVASVIAVVVAMRTVAQDRPRYRLIIRKLKGHTSTQSDPRSLGDRVVSAEVVNEGKQRGFIYPPTLRILDERLLEVSRDCDAHLKPGDYADEVGRWNHERLPPDRPIALEPGESAAFAYHVEPEEFPLFLMMWDSRATSIRYSVTRGWRFIQIVAARRHGRGTQKLLDAVLFHLHGRKVRHEIPVDREDREAFRWVRKFARALRKRRGRTK